MAKPKGKRDVSKFRWVAGGVIQSGVIGMFWKNERDRHGWVKSERVQMYEVQFTSKKDETYGNRRCLVICDTVEDAIAGCRKQWPDMVLHQIVKRNQRCDLIIDDSALGLAGGETGK